jgi:hypothetical protein
VPDLNRIFVPFRTDVRRYAVRDRRSTLFEPRGRAAIQGGAWALPVAVVAPASLGPASGGGALALQLDEGLGASWTGQSRELGLGPATLMGEPGRLVLVARAARGAGTRQVVPLWKGTTEARSRLELSWPHEFPLRFFSEGAGAEALLLSGNLTASLDRPLTLDGNRLPVRARQALTLVVLFEHAGGRGLLAQARVDPPRDGRRAFAFALANAVFKVTPPSGLLVLGSLAADGISQGTLTLQLGFQYLLPTLPDPYASNHELAWRRLRETVDLGPLLARVDWSPTLPARLGFQLPPEAGALTAPTPREPRDEPPSDAGRSVDKSLLDGFEGLILLDLSTSADQFGVGYGPFSQRPTLSSSPRFAVEDMYLQGRPTILTVPAVQWEPVATPEQLPPPAPSFPTPLSFANSGGPTSIAVQTVTLVPMAPRPALDELVANFRERAEPDPAVARFTLPFGMVAMAHLRKTRDPAARTADVRYNRPRFSTQDLEGGHQVSLHADDPSLPPGSTPSFDGWTLQLRNGLHLGVPTGRSVLDNSTDTIFNGYVGPTGIRRQVPVTRVDVSGYGESLFSDWRNPTDDPVAVSQARFDVLVGRTSLEIIQVRSILYPYAVRVVRTVTIERRNNARVTRRDSGWQAVTDGEYVYPGGVLVTHPGVVRRIRKVVNIRETGQVVTVDGVEMAAVRFDGDLEIEGTIKGGTAEGVPARDQLGFVQLTPIATGAISPATYQKLIATVGPMGGALDCLIDIGGSGQTMRVGRVGVGTTQGMGGPEFAMAAWGSPVLPSGGQWSVMRQAVAGDAPVPVDRELGVPLIRAGAAPSAPPLTSPYRFADPADLARPDFPAADYGLLHATGTQRVFFPRPKIEADGSRRLTSTRIPALADLYSLTTAVGLFPRLADTIPFPSSTWALAIAPDSHYRLEPAPSFPVTVGQRTLSDGQSVRAFADYTGSRVELSIDTAAAVPWSFVLRDVTLVTSSGSLGEVIRVKGTLEGSAAAPARLRDAQISFGGALQPVQDILVFLQHLGADALPPLDVSLTNAWKASMGLSIPLDFLFNLIPLPEGPKFKDTELAASVIVESEEAPKAGAEFEFKGNILIPTNFPFVKAVGRIELKIALSTRFGTVFVLTVGAGAGIFAENPLFELNMYVVRTMFFITGDNVIGLGTGLIGKGTIDFRIIGLEVTVEAKLAVVKVECPPDEHNVWLVGVLSIAVEISIFFVFELSIEVEVGFEEEIIEGPCELPNVV